MVVAVLAAWPAGGLLSAEVGVIRINGVIGPATGSYIGRAINVAASRQYRCLVVELDTPGGLLETTKTIVQDFYASRVPIVVYVTPSGASAGSAGTFITMAADVAAMAPHTTIGAAHPVSIGGGTPGGGEQKSDDVMKKKLENYASSDIQAIAEKRGRNAEWAKSAVTNSECITAEKALELKVVDLIAADLPALLNQIDNREINGQPLKTAGAIVVPIPMSAREKLFQAMARPEVMLVLMMIATFGIIAELNSPGAVLPGVAGAIALVLGLYLGSVLPVNVAGLALLGIAIVLFIVDIYAPTHGVLTIGGIIAFFLGALMLFNRAEPAFRLSLGYIIPATLLTAAFFIFIVGAGLRAQLLPVRAGKETMLGKTTTALSSIDPSGGKVFVEGEYWNAVSDTPVQPGQLVQILGVNGLTLKVKPKT
jgi:membrane-bound serine protease (ClpP class)